MHPEQITLYYISKRLQHPFQTSFGIEHDREALIVRVEEAGAVGWGECVASNGPWYSPETAETAWHILSNYLIPLVFQQDFDDPAEVFDLLSPVKGHRMAKAGLEMALWDLAAVQQGVSLSKLLGGTRDRVQVGVSVGVQESIDALVDRVAGFLDQGYSRIKIKIKPGWDVEPVRALRADFPDVLLQIDANSAYTLDDVDIFKELDQYNLLLIEQPLAHDDIYFHSKLQMELETPICLDESIISVEYAQAALELRSCGIINIKPGRVGGHTSSKRIHNLCRKRSVPLWHGGMLETGIGRAHSVALASLPGFTLPGDISASERYYAEDIVAPAFTLNEDSTLSVPAGPGIGVEVLTRRLKDVTLRRVEFTR